MTEASEADARSARREREDAVLRRLRDDFGYYSPRVLKVQDKDTGKLVPLTLNRTQLFVHQALEKQRQETGKVRAIIVKCRQPGISTYVEARFYHQGSTRRGRNVYILSHKDESTKSIFDMVERYYDHDLIIHPHADRSNAKELRFDRMDSRFRVATAGGEAVGHGTTNHLFHGSEVAYWANPGAHMTGVGQTIPNARDTEIILESTANGRGTWFHGICRDAEKGIGEYQIIFIPWFWVPEYSLALPHGGFDFTVEDLEYQDVYQISREQLYWRRIKIDSPDFKGDVLLFQQSYPATLAEAFISREGSFIPATAIARARKTQIDDPVGPLVLGADPTAYGEDRFAIAGRVGRKQVLKEAHSNWGPMQAANRLAHLIEHGVEVEGRGHMYPAKVFVDKVGVGAGTVDRLHELGYDDIVIGVSGGEKVSDPQLWFNKKAEMWDHMREAIEDEPFQLADDDDLDADLTAPRYERDVTAQRLKIESKESLRKRGVRSPDNADALALTFAYPVSDRLETNTTGTPRTAPRRIKRRERSWQSR